MTAEELKQMQEEQAKLIKELRATLDSKTAETAEAKSKIEKLNTRLDELEQKNQQHVVELQAQKNAAVEQKAALDGLQAKLFRLGNGAAPEKTLHRKAFEKYIMQGDKVLNPEELKFLRTDNASQAGVLAPPEHVLEIIKGITEISPMRSIARVRPTTRGSIEIPRRTALMSGYWVGEGGTQTESESTYGEEVIATKEATAYAIVSHKMLNDSAFNMDSEINADIIETLAQLEGAAFVTGDGINRPKGFTTDTTVIAACTNSGVADNIDADTIITLTGTLKVGYNPVFAFNRTTLAAIRQLKDGSGRYIWVEGIAGNVPNTLCGYPYVLLPDMANIAANAYPIAFGDFKRGYTIADGMQLYMIRDEFTLATTGKIQYVALKSVGGKVTLPEAIKLYKCAA